MKCVKNAGPAIKIAFEGFTYSLVPDQVALAEDAVADFLHDRYPWVGVYLPPKTKGTDIAEIRKVPNKTFAAKRENDSDMRISPSRTFDETQRTSVDGIDNGMDRDGVTWSGGVEDDSLTDTTTFH